MYIPATAVIGPYKKLN